MLSRVSRSQVTLCCHVSVTGHIVLSRVSVTGHIVLLRVCHRSHCDVTCLTVTCYMLSRVSLSQVTLMGMMITTLLSLYYYYSCLIFLMFEHGCMNMLFWVPYIPDV